MFDKIKTWVLENKIKAGAIAVGTVVVAVVLWKQFKK